MNIEIPDEVMSKMIDAELKATIHNKIINVMNNGSANWFSEFNIKNETRLAIRQLISEHVNKEVVDYINKIDYENLSTMIGHIISECLMSQVFDIDKNGD